MTANASPPKTTTPASSVGTGWRTTRPATWPQTPDLPVPWMSQGSSFGLPKMARKSVRLAASSDSRIDSSAGSKVSPASRMTPMAIANGMPRSE